MRRLLVLGFGYTARRFVERHGGMFETVSVTARTAEKIEHLKSEGYDAYRLVTGIPLSPELVVAAKAATHVLVSVPPSEDGDPAFTALGHTLGESIDLVWVGYLSTTGVYGDHGGRWIDEETETAPKSARSRRRLDAEEEWRTLAAPGRAVQIFRLSGIYGPGNSVFDGLREGKARRLHKPDQVFNRIHVDDIAAVLKAAIEHPEAGPVFNLGDDEPVPQHEVVAYAAGLLGMEPSPVVPFDEAQMSEMAKSFWAENKRIRNTRVRTELGVDLLYPTYRAGLKAILEEEAAGRQPV
ncbi:SDR family oxidoreductase [Flaviflagellibacter deserti]|uniref:SDR family oxidoreductase n=1 Tax=Flaviflagellibacter deserti TaxID=2267266 RepID=A0ABV9Z1A0_9HYPH